METTLEVRWFIPGKVPDKIQQWFQGECPGNFLQETPENREDIYFKQKSLAVYLPSESFIFAQAIASDITNPEVLNLKLRGGNLEIKLRNQKLGTEQFTNEQQFVAWTGNCEKWAKFSEKELKNLGLLKEELISSNQKISVYKKRIQKIEQNVKSELTRLKIARQFWWTIAFEMSQNNSSEQLKDRFLKVIQRSCQNYNSDQLLASHSYSYSHWLWLH